MPLVAQHDAEARVEEREFPQPPLQHGMVEFGLREGAGARLERDLGAGRLAAGADDREGSDRVAMLEADEVLLAIAPDADIHPLGERVDHGGAYAVQAAGDLVAVLVELAARVQPRQHHLGGGDPLLDVHVGRDAATVVAHGYAAVGVERQLAARGIAGLRLVHGVVYDLERHVVQAGAVVGVADIHAGPFAHGIQPLEHGDGRGVIRRRIGLLEGLGHAFGIPLEERLLRSGI